MSLCRRRVPRNAVSSIKRGPLMKMTAMKKNITLINALTIVGLAVRIMMKLAQVARELIQLSGD